MTTQLKPKNDGYLMLKKTAKRRRLKFDNNAVVKEGMEVNAWFTKKMEDRHLFVANYKIDGKICSGVLHVSQLPGKTREERDSMFELLKAPVGTFKLKVIEVVPPTGLRRLTFVRLTAREDFDPEIFKAAQERRARRLQSGEPQAAPSDDLAPAA